jgi:CheY-like chemotaxis protein
MREAGVPRILVVDDEPSVIEDYHYILSPRTSGAGDSLFSRLEDDLFGTAHPRALLPGVDLVVHRRSNDAIEEVRISLAEKRAFSVAFIDIHMPPDLDGVRCAERIRALDAQIQIVMVAGNTDIHPMDIVDRVPPADKILYLQKPFHAHEIQQLTYSLSARWRAELHPDVAGRGMEAASTGRGLSTTLQRLPAGIAVFDRYDRLVTWNGVMAQMFPEVTHCLAPGTSYEEIFDEVANELLPEDTLHRPSAWVRDHMAWHNNVGGSREYRLRGPVWILIVEKAVATGETYCLFCDVTALKMRETSREVASRMTFMAHAVASMCEQAGVPKEPDRRLSGDPQVSANPGELWAKTPALYEQHIGLDMADKINATAQQLKLNTRTVDVEQILRQSARSVNHLAPCVSGPKVVCDAGLWPISLDAEKFRCVLCEVIANACEAAGEDCELTLDAANVRVTQDFVSTRSGFSTGDYVRISVRDNGPGMSPGLTDRAVNPFFTTKSGAGHLGLGLSAAYGFASQSNGYLEIETVESRGASIIFYFRRSTEPEEIPDSTGVAFTEPNKGPGHLEAD